MPVRVLLKVGASHFEELRPDSPLLQAPTHFEARSLPVGRLRAQKDAMDFRSAWGCGV